LGRLVSVENSGPTSPLKSPVLRQDFVGGLTVIVNAGFAFWHAADLPTGTLGGMGPGMSRLRDRKHRLCVSYFDGTPITVAQLLRLDELVAERSWMLGNPSRVALLWQLTD
jgi:hypothetical protein